MTSAPESSRDVRHKAVAYKPGDLIAENYEVIRPLRTGGSGEVYLVRHVNFENREMAMKVVDLSDVEDESADVTVARFRNEVIATYQVNHPNVVRTFAYVQEGDLVGFTMEYVVGGDLADFVGNGKRISMPQALHVLGQICDGVKAIHDAGIIHRDLKPENILITEDGNVKISDFGIARMGTTLSKGGGITGTIQYLSPEYLKEGELDQRSDVFSLGVLSYEMITGKTPYSGGSLYETLTSRFHQNPTPPHELNEMCPPALSAMVLKALKPDPRQRFQSVGEMQAEVEKISAEWFGSENVGALQRSDRREQQQESFGVGYSYALQEDEFQAMLAEVREAERMQRHSLAEEDDWMDQAINTAETPLPPFAESQTDPELPDALDQQARFSGHDAGFPLFRSPGEESSVEQHYDINQERKIEPALYHQPLTRASETSQRRKLPLLKLLLLMAFGLTLGLGGAALVAKLSMGGPAMPPLLTPSAEDPAAGSQTIEGEVAANGSNEQITDQPAGGGDAEQAMPENSADSQQPAAAESRPPRVAEVVAEKLAQLEPTKPEEIEEFQQEQEEPAAAQVRTVPPFGSPAAVDSPAANEEDEIRRRTKSASLAPSRRSSLLETAPRGWYLVISTHHSKASAQAEVNTLQSVGREAQLQAVAGITAVEFQVLLGPFKQKKDAADMMKSLEAATPGRQFPVIQVK